MIRVPRLRPDLAPRRGHQCALLGVLGRCVLCVIGVVAVVVAFPALLRYDADDWVAAPVASST
jgi:hypothetical protein